MWLTSHADNYMPKIHIKKLILTVGNVHNFVEGINKWRVMINI